MTRSSSSRRLPNAAVGLIAIVLILLGFYLAFTKSLPWSGGYEIEAVFKNAQNLRVKSPVRIAGVNVGEVKEVKPLGNGAPAALVTMQISDAGRPIHTDARIQLRPRLFLEGNLFADVHPGSPSAPELDDGDTIPIQQTSNSVQLDQVLTTLQADVRGNLQLLLKELGNSFEKYGGAEGLREFYRTGGPANKNTALVNEATLGTRAHDLSGLVRNFDIVARALDRNEPQLKDLVTNLRTVTGSFAAEDQALAASIHELPLVLEAARPALRNLNASFPFVRAFAREALPGTRGAPAAIDAATPWIAQLRGLVSKPELRGLTHDLRGTVPQLAKLTRRQKPFMEQSRALASCFDRVVIPWSEGTVPSNDGESGVGKVYQETGYGLTGIAGESRSGDANGQTIRVAAGGGTNTISALPPPNTVIEPVGTVPGVGEQLVGVTNFKILGSDPPVDTAVKSPFKPQVPCENQEPPNLSTGGPGAAPQQVSRQGGQVQGGAAYNQLADLSRKYAGLYTDYLKASGLQSVNSSRRNDGLLVDALKGLMDFSKNDLPDYNKAVRGLGGGGN
jgi:phospholipid/cholesterol/gamma-HCH transport system substrate-binding protein